MTLILSILFTVNPVNKFHIYKGAVEDKLSCAELRPYCAELRPYTGGLSEDKLSYAE